MLKHLFIQDFLIIEKASVDFHERFTVITGETGSGKSILLHALNLIFGSKLSQNVVRPGASQAIISCLLEIPASLRNLMCADGFHMEDNNLLIRRIIDSDNKSKIFMNDQLITLNFLKNHLTQCVSMHGQFDDLFELEYQREIVDIYGGFHAEVQELKKIYASWQQVKNQIDILHANQGMDDSQKDYFLFALAELKNMNPQANEESFLLEKRQNAINIQKIKDVLLRINNALIGENGIYDLVQSMHKDNQKLLTLMSHPYSIADNLNTLHPILAEVERALLHVQKDVLDEGMALEDIDDRLHILRNAARKYRCTADQLCEKISDFQTKLTCSNQDEEVLAQLIAEAHKLKILYEQSAFKIHEQRKQAANTLEINLEKEFPNLRLDKAKIKISVEPLSLQESGPTGMSKIVFLVQMNPGIPFTNLSQTASGGELSRMMLAMRVVLQGKLDHKLVIFDEIDAGTGGAVAHTIGQKLNYMSSYSQIIAITHAPQVAAEAHMHCRIQKQQDLDSTCMTIHTLTDEERLEEIARMLSGEIVTEASRKAAVALLRKAV